MFVYQNGEVLNIVKGNMPKAIPEISVGFEGESTVIKIGGVTIPTASSEGTIQLTDTVISGGRTFDIVNPDLTVTLENNGYTLSGTVSPASDETTTYWGYEKDAPLYVVRVVFDGITDITDPEQAAAFSGVCNGKTDAKPIDPAKFDGPNYIDYVFDASQKDYSVGSGPITIEYSTDNKATTKTITITNKTTNLVQE